MVREGATTQEYPIKSTVMTVLYSMLSERKFYNREKIEMLKRFTNLSLVEVDRHDAENYPSRIRSFGDTIKVYHPDFELEDNPTVDSLDQNINKWLIEKKLNIPEVDDWFKTNLVWEHIMGGGGQSEIPEEWRKYLNVDIRDRRLGFPAKESVWGWEQIEPEEKIFAYRMVTSYYFARAICACLGSESVDQVAGMAAIYQLATDRYHQKNPGEPLLTLVVDAIKDRTQYSDRQEALSIAKITRVRPVVAEAAIIATRILSKLTGRRAEWDSKD